MSKHTTNAKGKPDGANGASATAAHAPAIQAGVEIKPNAEAVRRRAYELYLDRARTGKPGDETADWVQAEKELHARR
jgi:hypothetical protein